MMSGSGFCWWRLLCECARQPDALRAPGCKLHILVCWNYTELLSYLCWPGSEAAGKQTCSSAAQAQPEPENVIFGPLHEKKHFNSVRSTTRTKQAGMRRTAEGRNMIAGSHIDSHDDYKESLFWNECQDLKPLSWLV